MVKLFNVRLNVDLKEKLDRGAEELGLSTSEAARQALEWWSSFDPGFMREIANLSESLNAPPWRILQVIFAKRLARFEAMGEVRGLVASEISFYSELGLAAEGVTADFGELKRHLKANEIQRERGRKANSHA